MAKGYQIYKQLVKKAIQCKTELFCGNETQENKDGTRLQLIILKIIKLRKKGKFALKY